MKKQNGFSLIGILLIIGVLVITAGGVVGLPTVRQVWKEKASPVTTSTPTPALTSPTPTTVSAVSPAVTTDEETISEVVVEVKFAEGSGVRLRDGRLISITGQDLNALDLLLNQYSVLKIERLFTQPEEKLERMRKPGTSDLNLWYRITLGRETETESFIKNLKGLEIVEKAEPAPLPAPPPLM